MEHEFVFKFGPPPSSLTQYRTNQSKLVYRLQIIHKPNPKLKSNLNLSAWPITLTMNLVTAY